MKEYYLTKEKIDAFASMLYQAEKSKATIEKYLRSIRMFSQYLAGNPVNKSAAITWKEQLQQQNNYAPSTVNAALAALNNLFSFLGWTDCRTHYLKIQRRLFRDAGQELCREDYERLVSAAYNTGHKKIALSLWKLHEQGRLLFSSREKSARLFYLPNCVENYWTMRKHRKIPPERYSSPEAKSPWDVVGFGQR